MGVTIKCLSCQKSITFEVFFTNPKYCPNCKHEWDYSKTKTTKLRRKDK